MPQGERGGCVLDDDQGVDAPHGHAQRRTHRAYPVARFILADVLSLPLADASADLLLDRGCFHYLAPADRHRYAREARRFCAAAAGSYSAPAGQPLACPTTSTRP